MKFPTTMSRLALFRVAAFAFLVPFAETAHCEIEPAARAVAEAASAKIGGAQTLRLSVRHTIDPLIGVGSKLDDAPITVTVQRPNRFHAIHAAKDATREIVYDGRTLVVMHPQLRHHATAVLPTSSIEQFADELEARFGFRPPMAEFLAAKFDEQLFRNVTSAALVGTEFVGFTRCNRLHLEQEGMRADVWIGVKDHLPRRCLLTFTALAGQPTWNIRMSKWELNIPVDSALFEKRPASDSSEVRMLSSQ